MIGHDVCQNRVNTTSKTYTIVFVGNRERQSFTQTDRDGDVISVGPRGLS